MHLLKSMLNFSPSIGLQHLNVARDQRFPKIYSTTFGEDARRTVTQWQNRCNLACRNSGHDSRGDRDEPIESLVLSIGPDLTLTARGLG